jgi:hypothetical protein
MHSRGTIWMCATMGTLVGGFVPALWGGSQLGVASLLFAALGGFAGVWAGVRLTT